jgi:outer membrane receptor for ferrienterochelin and colicins
MFLNKILVMLVFLASILSYCQDNRQQIDSTNHELNEVIVTATRTKRQLASVPMPVTLISKKQILQTGATRLRDIILEQTGIIMVTDVGNSEGVQMQGVSADYTLILVNGLPLIGRTSGNIDLNRLSIHNIKQIEIVKGPSSSLYGSEALGGVINIITETPKEGVSKGSVSYMTRFESREELDLNANYTYGDEVFGVDVGLNLNSGGSYDISPGDDVNTAEAYQNSTTSASLSYKISENFRVLLDGRLFTEEIFHQSQDASRLDMSGCFTLSQRVSSKVAIKYLLYATNYNTKSVFNEETSEYNQLLYRPEVRSEIRLKLGTLVTGFGGNFDSLERTYFDGKEQFNAHYVFAQFDTNFLEKVNLIAGIRYDDFNKFKSAFSPKLSINYKVNNWLTAKSSIGFGYKVPDFRQLFFNFRNTAGGYVVLGTQVLHDLYGNLPEVSRLSKELSPESSIGYNFGLQLKPSSVLNLSLNFFRNDIKDLINTFVVSQNFPDLPNTSVFSYENRDRVFTQGIELDATLKLNPNVRLSLGYQFLDTGDKEELAKIKRDEVFFRRTPTSPSEILTAADYFGLANRSKHTANFKLFYNNFTHDFSVNARVLYRSKYALFDTNNSSDVIDAYDNFIAGNTQVNISMEKKFSDILSFQFGIDNLFNSNGEENNKSFENLDSALRLGRTFYTRIQLHI